MATFHFLLPVHPERLGLQPSFRERCRLTPCLKPSTYPCRFSPTEVYLRSPRISIEGKKETRAFFRGQLPPSLQPIPLQLMDDAFFLPVEKIDEADLVISSVSLVPGGLYGESKIARLEQQKATPCQPSLRLLR